MLTEQQTNTLGQMAVAVGAGSPTAWALGTIAARTLLVPGDRSILLALAALAARDLSDPDGYRGNTVAEVAELLARPEHAVSAAMRSGPLLGLLERSGGFYRLPERAFNLEAHPSF